jgi:hypothetical protein
VCTIQILFYTFVTSENAKYYIEGSIPDTIGNLTNLEYLGLAANQSRV